jgi:uncharacterized protein YqjF (DUF2071 family)
MFDEDFIDPTVNVAHRPWPLPRRPWIMTQRWSDLLFMHWPVPTDAVRTLVPRNLELDLRQGTAWVTITPLYLSHLRLRGMPAVPGLSAFPEINVRTYVTRGGRPGVFFFSLDAGNRFAVLAARSLYHLPYYRADMSIRRRADGAIEYRSHRAGSPSADFAATYAPDGPAHHAEAGSLDHWLSERYCLYSLGPGGGVYRAEIHHHPWPLHRAHAETMENTMASAAGMTLPADPPRLAFARRLDVVVWDKEHID